MIPLLPGLVHRLVQPEVPICYALIRKMCKKNTGMCICVRNVLSAGVWVCFSWKYWLECFRVSVPEPVPVAMPSWIPIRLGLPVPQLLVLNALHEALVLRDEPLVVTVGDRQSRREPPNLEFPYYFTLNNNDTISKKYVIFVSQPTSVLMDNAWKSNYKSSRIRRAS